MSDLRARLRALRGEASAEELEGRVVPSDAVAGERASIMIVWPVM